MRVYIASEDLPALKQYLHRSLPDHKPSHRIEAAARGFGFTTHAGLRETLAAGPVALTADDRRFCAELGTPFEADGDYNRYLSRAIARIELHRVLNATPRLTQRGFDSAWMPVSGEMDKPLRERLSMLEERRQEAYESDWSFDQFDLAWIYLSRQQKIKSINRRTGSYGLKHRAENLMREFGHFRPLGNYVSNGMLIAAAYSLGFDVKPVGSGNYNAYLNISMVTVNRSRGRQPRSATQDPALVAAMYSDLDMVLT
ncbi:MAG: hypothetical protein M3Q08_02105 [Pseudomonadota bacterium]|nr:hypothetical protein [Pseudomonadota bacterium]